MPNIWLPSFIHTCPQCYHKIPLQYTASIFMQNIFCDRCHHVSEGAHISLGVVQTLAPQSTPQQQQQEQQQQQQHDPPSASINPVDADPSDAYLAELLTKYLSFNGPPNQPTASSLTLQDGPFSDPSSLSSSLDNQFSGFQHLDPPRFQQPEPGRASSNKDSSSPKLTTAFSPRAEDGRDDSNAAWHASHRSNIPTYASVHYTHSAHVTTATKTGTNVVQTDVNTTGEEDVDMG